MGHCELGARRVGAAGIIALLLCAATLAAAPCRALAGSSPALIAYDDDALGVFEFPIGAHKPSLAVRGAVDPAFSPNGTELAYLVLRNGTYGDAAAHNSIVVADRDGAHPRTILTGPVQFNGDPNSIFAGLAWSPNGRELAYGCAGTQDVDPTDPVIRGYDRLQLCVVNVQTGAHHMVTDPSTDTAPIKGPGETQPLSWTPDGTRVVADVYDEEPCSAGEPFPGAVCGTNQVGVIDVATGGTDVLTQPGAPYPGGDQAVDPVLSPKGTHILFWKFSNTVDYGVQEMGLGGGGARTVSTDAQRAGTRSLAWSPDGRSFLFTTFSSANDYELNPFELPISGAGKPRMIFNVNTNVYSPVWTGPLTTCTVPKLRGRTLAQARTLLRRAACSLGRVNGPASHRSTRHVVAQSLRAGTSRPAGTRVAVKLG